METRGRSGQGRRRRRLCAGKTAAQPLNRDDVPPILNEVSSLRKLTIDESNVAGILATYPELLALTVLIAGFVLARLASYSTGVALDAIDRRTARITTSDRHVVTPGLIRFSRGFVFWIVLAFAILLSLRILGAGNVSTLLGQVIEFIPQVLVAFAIIVAGHLLGLIASQVLVRIAPGLSADSLAPRFAYAVIVTVSVVMGLQHLNVDISFVTQLMLIMFAIVGGGLMLAFSLGARQHVANLLARREMGRLRVGDHIEIDGIDGSIVEIHATAVDIATDSGIAPVPAARFAEATIVRKPEGADGA